MNKYKLSSDELTYSPVKLNQFYDLQIKFPKQNLQLHLHFLCISKNVLQIFIFGIYEMFWKRKHVQLYILNQILLYCIVSDYSFQLGIIINNSVNFKTWGESSYELPLNVYNHVFYRAR